MRDLTLVVSFVLLAGALAAVWCTQQADDNTETARSALARQQERGRLLDLQAAQRQAFQAYCDVQLFKVAFGVQSLAQACRDIERYAAVHCPLYLKGVSALGQGQSLREKLAHSLVSGLTIPRLHDGRRLHDPVIALRLVSEMAEATTQP